MSRFLKDSIWQGAGTVFQLAANFAGQGILNIFLGPSGRGLLAFVQAVSGTAMVPLRHDAYAASRYSSESWS